MKKIQGLIILTIIILTTIISGCNEQNTNNMNGNNGINLKPVAVASADPTSGKAPVTVRFSSSGSYDPDGEIVSYKWDLGLEGGRVDSTKNPIHIYTEPGNYTVKLIVIDNDNAFSNESIVKLTIN